MKNKWVAAADVFQLTIYYLPEKPLFMVEKLTVIFFVILCVLLGTYLILAPWTGIFGSWNDNFFLVLLTDKTGSQVLQNVVGSTWFRGGITGLGVLNLLIAFWEAANFNQSVEMLKTDNSSAAKGKK